jgi:hypothetical protein
VKYYLTQTTCDTCHSTSDVYVATYDSGAPLSGATARFFCQCNSEVIFRMESIIILDAPPAVGVRGSLLLGEYDQFFQKE